MIGVLIIALLQATEPAAPADIAPVAQERPVPAGMMSCDPWDRGTRTRICRTAEGAVLRCRRETQLGSRFPTLVCLEHRVDEQLTEDSRRYLDRQQHIPDNRAN